MLYEARKGDKRFKCKNCGKDFWAALYTAKYCGATCRKAAQRDREGLNKALLLAMKQVDIISSYMHEDDRTDIKARRALAELRNYIDGKLSR